MLDHKTLSLMRFPLAACFVVVSVFQGSNPRAVNFAKKLNLFSEYWAPKVIAEMNDYQLKIVKIKGDGMVIFYKYDTPFIILYFTKLNDLIIKNSEGCLLFLLIR